MMIQILKSKLHRACVTAGHVDYEGSLTVSEDLMEAVGFLPYEKILVGNITNGKRFETSLIAGKRGEGTICLNGGCAHRGKPGDLLTIMSFASIPVGDAATHQPRKATLATGNKLP
jgi:aspartate 1-decarboxylase